jgi:hypothetical protein
VSGSWRQRQPSRCQPRHRPGDHQNVIPSPAPFSFFSDQLIYFPNAVLLRRKAKTTFQPLWYDTPPESKRNCHYEPNRLCFLSAEHIVHRTAIAPFYSQFFTHQSILTLRAQVMFPRTRE